MVEGEFHFVCVLSTLGFPSGVWWGGHHLLQELWGVHPARSPAQKAALSFPCAKEALLVHSSSCNEVGGGEEADNEQTVLLRVLGAGEPKTKVPADSVPAEGPLPGSSSPWVLSW